MEIWKNIQGFDGYQVSNYGRFKSFRRYPQGKFMKVVKNGRGYGVVCLRINGRGKSMTYDAHRLVAKAFISLKPNCPQVNHKDFNQMNNHVDNLEWCTPKKNVRHAIRHGRWRNQKGENNNMVILNTFQVQRIRLMKEIKPAAQIQEIANIFKVSWTTISDVLKRKTWKHV